MILGAILLFIAASLNIVLGAMYYMARNYGTEDTVHPNVFCALMLVEDLCWMGAVVKLIMVAIA